MAATIIASIALGLSVLSAALSAAVVVWQRFFQKPRFWVTFGQAELDVLPAPWPDTESMKDPRVLRNVILKIAYTGGGKRTAITNAALTSKHWHLLDLLHAEDVFEIEPGAAGVFQFHHAVGKAIDVDLDEMPFSIVLDCAGELYNLPIWLLVVREKTGLMFYPKEQFDRIARASSLPKARKTNSP